MRIKIDHKNNDLMTGPGDIYATEIAGAGNAFAYAIYEHSKLPLRVFEAARLMTAMINGCQICMTWQSKRDVHQMGITHGVISNGEAPDKKFYSNILSNNFEDLSDQELMAIKFAQGMGQDPKQWQQWQIQWQKDQQQILDERLKAAAASPAGRLPSSSDVIYTTRSDLVDAAD